MLFINLFFITAIHLYEYDLIEYTWGRQCSPALLHLTKFQKSDKTQAIN